ncbi:MAG: hypothetical protein Kow0068_13210 [Marinilabiliales bacterium]
MKVIACRPKDNQFWIGCSEEEAKTIFLPLLSESEKENYKIIAEDIKHKSEAYWNAVKEILNTEEKYHAYFNVSRDLSICYPERPHFPFANMWDGYSPFRKIDQKTIYSLDELKELKMTYQGKEYESK